MDLVVLGLIFDIVGVFILASVAVVDYPHQKRPAEKKLQKRYWWQGPRPLYKDTKTLEWKIKWNRVVIVEGFIPPKHLWNGIGFLWVLGGFLLQLGFYLA